MKNSTVPVASPTPAYAAPSVELVLDADTLSQEIVIAGYSSGVTK